MRKKTILAATIISIIGTALLAGCGSGSDANTPNTVQQNEVSQTEETAPAAQQEQESEEEKPETEDAQQESETEDTQEPKEGDEEEIASPEDTEEQPGEDEEYRDYEEPFGEEKSVDAETRRKMNIFLSNFSEAGLSVYDKDNKDLIDILWWTHIWTKINKWKNIEYEELPEHGTCEKNSLENINKILDKYLGFTLTEAEIADLDQPDEDYGFFFQDGNLYCPAADGESYTLLTIISGVEDLGNDKLKLYFTVYSQDLDAYFDGKEKDGYYSLSADEAMADPELEQYDVGYAIVACEGSSYKLEHLEIK